MMGHDSNLIQNVSVEERACDNELACSCRCESFQDNYAMNREEPTASYG